MWHRCRHAFGKLKTSTGEKYNSHNSKEWLDPFASGVCSDPFLRLLIGLLPPPQTRKGIHPGNVILVVSQKPRRDAGASSKHYLSLAVNAEEGDILNPDRRSIVKTV